MKKIPFKKLALTAETLKVMMDGSGFHPSIHAS